MGADEADSVTAKSCVESERRARYRAADPGAHGRGAGRSVLLRCHHRFEKPNGYGIYFRKEDTLYFVELQADNDRAAEVLMEAAREKRKSVVERGGHYRGASQPLFLGEGTRQDYGMIRFDAEPFDVAESYMRLMLEN